MDKEKQIDVQNLKKHQEFWALKSLLEDFCDDLENISDMDLTKQSRVSVGEEIAGRLWASKKTRDLLSSLGLVDKTKPKIIDKTGE